MASQTVVSPRLAELPFHAEKLIHAAVHAFLAVLMTATHQLHQGLIWHEHRLLVQFSVGHLPPTQVFWDGITQIGHLTTP